MALTEGEDTFVSVADADTFWSNRNDTDWTNASQEEKEAALRDATVYIDNEYDWPGSIADANQDLSWPRDEAYDSEGRKLTDTPQAVKDATAYLAGQAVKGEDIFSVQDKSSQIKSLAAGSVAIEYEDHASAERVFEYLKSILSRITNTSSNQVKLVRS